MHFLVLSGSTHGAAPSPLLKAFTILRSLHKLQAAGKILEECLKKEEEIRGQGEQKQTRKKASEDMSMRNNRNVTPLGYGRLNFSPLYRRLID